MTEVTKIHQVVSFLRSLRIAIDRTVSIFK